MLGLACARLANVPLVTGRAGRLSCLPASPSECTAKNQDGSFGLRYINPDGLAGYGTDLQAGGAYLERH